MAGKQILQGSVTSIHSGAVNLLICRCDTRQSYLCIEVLVMNFTGSCRSPEYVRKEQASRTFGLSTLHEAVDYQVVMCMYSRL